MLCTGPTAHACSLSDCGGEVQSGHNRLWHLGAPHMPGVTRMLLAEWPNTLCCSYFNFLGRREGKSRRILCHVGLQLNPSSFTLLLKQFHRICMTVGKLPNLIVPSSPRLENGNKRTYFIWLFRGLNELKYINGFQ